MKSLFVLALGALLASCASSDAVKTELPGRAPVAQVRAEILSSMRGRLEWLAANPAVSPGVDPALPYRDLLRNLDELEGLPK